MRTLQEKIVTPEALKNIREQLRREGRTVVQCHGCFDIVHPGHIRYLQFARAQGDVLVVSLSADEVVSKGAERPYINQNLRAENLAAFEFVDYVVVDGNNWAGPILETVRPDVYVKGKEYETNHDARFAKEKALVEEYGGKVIFSSGDVVYSSTALLRRFKDKFNLEADRLKFYCERHRISAATLEQALAGMRGKRVLVLGDAILDRYVYSEELGVAAESPILAVKPFRDEWFLGAGALIAAQVNALGGQAGFLTAYGDTGDAAMFRALLANTDIELKLVRVDERPVYVKTRYLVDEKKVFKVDEGRRAPVSSVAQRALVSALAERLPSYDAVIATDFGYGLFGSEVIDGISRLMREANKPLYVDVSHTGHANILKFKHPRLATPTEHELRFAFGDHESGLSNLAARFFAETQASRMVLTMGKRGLILFENKPDSGGRIPADYLPALAAYAVDEVGAGDVMLATLALNDLAGGAAPVGAYLGSAAAAMHVGRLGNAPVALQDIYGFLASRPELAPA